MPESPPHAAGPEDELLRRVVDSVPAMLAYWDATLRCRYANGAYERWFGISPTTLIGKHISELLGPLYKLNLPHIEGALRGQPQQFEREIPDPAGGPPRYSVANYVPDVVNGVVRGFFVHVADVSARRRVELALRESEAKFSGIVSIAADAIITIDEDQRITIFNDGAERIFGYARAEILGAPLDLLLPPRWRAQHRGHVAGFSAGQSTARQMGERNATIVGRRKSGEEFPAEAAISKLDVGGRRLLTVALRDITDRKRVEMEYEVFAEAGAVLASSLNYKQTLKAIAQLVVSRVADLCIIDIVEGGEPLRLTVTPADPAKVSACERLAALPLEPRHQLTWSAIQTKRTQLLSDITPERWEAGAQSPEHLQLIRELAPRSAIVVPMFSGTGIFGALALASTTPGRFSDRDLDFVTELARRAALAIENARLFEAEQRATRARDAVLAIVAHDVRNPLASISFAAATLQHQLGPHTPATNAKSVELILRSVSRANHLIQDLLDTTRIEAGALPVDRGALAAGQVLLDAAEAEHGLAAAAALELRLEAERDLPAIWADRARLLQVFENLVGNALKFTPRGGRITLAAVSRGSEVLFSVTDTGAGISAENLPHVFDRFWRAERAERQGAGLGLPICKGIVEAHGGRIWVESLPGRGTTFSFTIPNAPSLDQRPGEAAPL